MHLLPYVNTVADLGVHVDRPKSLTYSNHCNIICAKANARANLILRSFHCKYVDVLVKAFVTFVRFLAKYASPAWSPRLVRDIALVERVQKRFTISVSLAFVTMIMLKDFSYCS